MNRPKKQFRSTFSACSIAILSMFFSLTGWVSNAQAQADQIIITTAPVSVTNTVGDNVEFFVAGYDNNTPTNDLTYQWADSAGPIVNATNHTLVLTNIQSASADTYTVTISDDSATNSASAVLTVVSTFNPNNNLAAWLTFDDGQSNPSSQTAQDASGNGNYGTLQSFETDGLEWVNGVAGGALFYANLNGASNNVVTIYDSPTLSFTNKLAFTLSAWVAGGTYNTFEGSLYSSPFFSGQLAGANIINKGYGGGGEQYELDAYSGGDFRFYIRSAAGATTGITSTTPVNNNGVWQHIVATYDGNLGYMGLYVNGVLVGSITNAPNSLLFSTQPVNIGNRPSTQSSGYNSPFVGLIDDARIYSYSLSSNDVKALYNSYSTNSLPNIYAAPNTNQPIYAGGNLPFYALQDGFSSPSYSWQYSGANTTSATNASTLIISNLTAGNNGTATLTVSNVNGTSSHAFSVTGLTPSFSYAQEVMSLNPLAFWQLNETNNRPTGTASSVGYDYAHGNNAIAGGATSPGVEGQSQPQFYGFPQGYQGLQFAQQTGGFALIPPFGLTNTTTATFTAWIYSTTANNGSEGLVFCRQSGQAGGMDYNGQLGYTWNNNSSSTYGWSSHLVATNNAWTFVAIVINSANTIGYMGGTNGLLYAATNAVANTLTANWTTAGNMFIGEDPNSGTIGTVNTGRIFQGRINNVAVFKGALTQSQIQGLYYAAGFVPEFPNMPTNLNVNQGQTGVISVTNIQGSLPMAYTWYDITTNGVSNFLSSGSLSNYTGNSLTLSISNAAPSQSGNAYYLSISNQFGTTVSNTLMNVFSAPAIIAGPTPSNVVIFPGQNATFSIAANGAQPLSYQWATNGTPISGSNSTNFTLTSVPLGTWLVTCTVSNVAGSITSSPAMVKVISPSAFQSQVLAYNPLAYWPLDETNGTTAYDLIGLNDGTYNSGCVLGVVGPTNAGIGSNLFAITLDGATGRVDVPVGDLNVTNSVTVAAWVQTQPGLLQNVSRADIIGHGNPSYRLTIDQYGYVHFGDGTGGTDQEVTNKVPINDGNWHMLMGVYNSSNASVTIYVDGLQGQSFTGNLPPAGTNLDLFIGDAPDANAFFQGNIGQAMIIPSALTSQQAQALYVGSDAAPEVLMPTNQFFVDENGSGSLSTTVLGTTPESLQWWFIDNSGNTNMAAGQTNATLTVSNVQTSQNGYQYYLVASNAYGMAAGQKAVLYVNSGLTITGPTPAYADLPEGVNMTYTVNATGTEPFSYQWLLNSSPISNATNSSYTFSTTAGTNQYACIVSNVDSVAASQTVTLAASPTPPSVNFTNASGWSLQGTSFTPSFNSSNVLTLTDAHGSEASSAYYTTAQYINGFEGSFVYTPSGGTSTRADGVTFNLQNSASGSSALGGPGGALGFSPISPSVALCLDIFSGAKGGTGINWETDGMTANGVGESGFSGQPNGGTGSVNINSLDPIEVTLLYNSGNGNLQVTLTDQTTKASFTTNYNVGSLPQILGSDTAYVGFTGGTGGDDAVQTISNFNFTYLQPLQPPVIVEDISPLSISTYAGTSVTYTVEATGTQPLSYFWLKNGVAIAGATNSTYTFAIPVGSNTYQCEVTNAESGANPTYSSVANVYGATITDAYGANILRYNPMAFWRLDEPAGSTVANDYIGGFNGVYGSSTTNGQPGVPNPPFLGMPQDELGVFMANTAGTNGFVSTESINQTLTNATLTCWIYPNGSQNVSEGLVFSRGTTANGINMGSANEFAYTWNNNAATYDWTSGMAIPTNAWSMLALVITPSNAVGYVMNQHAMLANTNQVANSPVAITAGFTLGADPQSGTLSTRIFNGEMDDVAVFDYAMTPSQIAQIFSLGSKGLVVSIQPSGSNFSITWPFGTLYSAPTAQGPWTQVAGATSPYTFTPSGNSMFFRVIAAP